MIKQIYLSDGSTVDVDEEDYYWLVGFNWSARNCNGKTYAVRRLPRRKQKISHFIYMHREVAERSNIDISDDVDHRDRNTRNNTRSNLRAATRTQTRQNSSLGARNPTGYRGVYPKSNGNYVGKIGVEGKSIHLGTFASPEEASAAYIVAAQEVFGEFIGQTIKG